MIACVCMAIGQRYTFANVCTRGRGDWSVLEEVIQCKGGCQDNTDITINEMMSYTILGVTQTLSEESQCDHQKESTND